MQKNYQYVAMLLYILLKIVDYKFTTIRFKLFSLFLCFSFYSSVSLNDKLNFLGGDIMEDLSGSTATTFMYACLGGNLDTVKTFSRSKQSEKDNDRKSGKQYLQENDVIK